jgi:hypothetical protein
MPRALFALLQTRNDVGHPILPWARLITSDLTQLHSHVKVASEELPDPMVCPTAWTDFFIQYKELGDFIVSQLHYAESVCDRTASDHGTVSAEMLTFKCDVCDAPVPAFSSLQALNQYWRKVHGVRNTMVYYAGADGICPSCMTTFASRLQLLGHLSDTRRPRCANYAIAHCARMSDSTVNLLDVSDRAARKVAYKTGRTHAIVKAPAKNASGRVVGRLSCA